MSVDARVHMRHVDSRDRKEIVLLMQRSRELHEPWISPPISNPAFNDYFARVSQTDHEGLVICQHDTGAIVGVINLNNIVRGSFLSASLGYYVGRPFAACGYMSEGLRLVREYAFGKLGLHRLEANIQPTNERSVALVKRCGFRREGISPAFLFINGQWRDHERWVCVDDRHTLQP